MKFFALVALAASASALKISKENAPFHVLPECEYHLSEDGLEC